MLHVLISTLLILLILSGSGKSTLSDYLASVGECTELSQSICQHVICCQAVGDCSTLCFPFHLNKSVGVTVGVCQLSQLTFYCCCCDQHHRQLVLSKPGHTRLKACLRSSCALSLAGWAASCYRQVSEQLIHQSLTLSAIIVER
jgi:hypothetical protein